MSPRDDDLAKLAGLCGWDWVPAAEADTTSIPWDDGCGVGAFRVLYPGVGANEVDGFPQTADVEDLIYVPAPDAPLPEAMAFVGRLCEALGPQSLRLVRMIPVPTVSFNRDGMEPVSGHAPDLAWAACRAAIAARQGGAT